MTYACDACGNTYARKHDLRRHKQHKHDHSERQIGKGKRAGSDPESDDDTIPRKHSILKRSKPYSADEGDEDKQELKRSDAIPDTNFVNSRNFLPKQVYDFQFKHPFCMMVAGPSRSGKTHWVANLLKKT